MLERATLRSQIRRSITDEWESPLTAMNRDRDEMRIDSRLNRVVTVIAEPRQLGKNGRELSERVRVAEKKQGGEINCAPLDSVSRSLMRDGCLPLAAKKPGGMTLDVRLATETLLPSTLSTRTGPFIKDAP